tara:strand:+ start:1128 stop:2003 length:876 start_codon:yes stop_codon:yes gene_type:complete
VQKGETLAKIAQENNITVRELMDLNELFDANQLKEGQVLNLPSNNNNTKSQPIDIHIVQEGESLNQISKKYNITKINIIKENNIKDPNQLYAGQKILLPISSLAQIKKDESQTEKASFHIVKEGETLTSIAKIYQIPIKKLIRINEINSPNSIKLGTKIFLKEVLIKESEEVTISKPLKESIAIKSNSQPIVNKEDIVSNSKSYPKHDQLYDWKEYGPLKINWTSWKEYEGNHVTSTIHKSGKPLFIAINCFKRRINRTGPAGEWRKWIDPRENFEHDLINDLCQSNPINL